MNKSKVLLFILLFAFALHINAQTTKEESLIESQKASQTKKEIHNQLEMMAKEMAQELKQPSFRGLLQSEISKSQNREHILESKIFLETAVKEVEAAQGLNKLKERDKKTRELIKTSGIWDLEGLDIYFPVEEHFKNWKGIEDILVAFSPLDNEEDISEIFAYSVKSGKRITLDIEIPPETPVLVIAPEEHETHEIKPPAFPTDEGALEGPEPKDAANLKDKSNNSYFGVKYLRIDDDQEPWIKGDPEIYAYYFQKGPTSCQKIYKDLYWVNEERSWYYVWPYLSRYFDSRYSDRSYLKIYERDGGTLRWYDVTISGQTCLYSKSDGDDYVASQWFWKSSYGFDYDYYIDMVRAAVKLRKIH